ncbi:hypothetical protein CVV65_05595 [Kyrpidia spormannii]|uniref:Uncharacterized protein n=1 Tax=Kyrpidia spormannii TaxID=2055160 RepID=A0A2K8N592_9BACL|nr:hypothetical protein CVV65_05595 [Kyrpidia spormannii]
MESKGQREVWRVTGLGWSRGKLRDWVTKIEEDLLCFTNGRERKEVVPVVVDFRDGLFLQFTR